MPPFTPVDGWILERPGEVEAAHREFVAAGAGILLAGTFLAHPGSSPRWREVARRAVELARRAASGRAAVWASIGPGPVEAVRALVGEVGPTVDGVVLETWTDPSSLKEAVRVVRSVWRGPLVASQVPGRVAPDLAALLAAGADGVGFNCGSGPGDVLAATRRAEVEALWARPAGGPFEDTVDALVELSARCRWVGGCCGVGPAMIAAARRRIG